MVKRLPRRSNDDEERFRFTVDLPVDLYKSLRVACVEKETTMADEIRRLVRAEYGRAGNPAGAKMGKPAARAT